MYQLVLVRVLYEALQDAGRRYAFVLSFFNHSSITFAAESEGLTLAFASILLLELIILQRYMYMHHVLF